MQVAIAVHQMSMLRDQILAFRRGGMSVEQICEVTKLAPAVVEMALCAQGGSRALRREEAQSAAVADDDEATDVSTEERREMLGIIKGIARSEQQNNPAVALGAAKYVHGVAAGHYRRFDINVDAHGLMLKINAAYEDANARAFAALSNVTPPRETKPPAVIVDAEISSLSNATACGAPAPAP